MTLFGGSTSMSLALAYVFLDAQTMHETSGDCLWCEEEDGEVHDDEDHADPLCKASAAFALPPPLSPPSPRGPPAPATEDEA
jgi:hypothetical protein